MRTLGFIPARAGSKGIPNKNLSVLAGRPLIQYTIEAALLSQLDQVVVSTDSNEIANFAKKCGAEVPELRPVALSQDLSRIEEALLHTLQTSLKNNPPDVIVLLQPTSPLRTHKYINQALDLLMQKNVDCVVSVSEPIEHPADMVSFENTKMEFLLKDHIQPGRTQRQAYPNYYYINGAIYAFKTESLLATGSRFGKSCAPLIMPSEVSLDIDSLAQIKLAEAFLQSTHYQDHV